MKKSTFLNLTCCFLLTFSQWHLVNKVLKYIFKYLDYVDLAFIYRVKIEPVVLKLHLNLLSLTFYCLIVLHLKAVSFNV